MHDYPLANAFLTMLYFFLWIIWIFLLIRIFMDIFRSHDMGGWAKAGWSAFVIILPFLGVFIYLIARGKGMAERDVHQAQAQDAAFRSYVQDAAGSGGGGGDVAALAKLGELHDKGVLTDAEFAAQKAKIVAA